MAASLWLFGSHELAVRLPSILLSTIGIWLTYQIGSSLFNRKIGYLAAFFYSINGLIIELTAGRWATDHVDIFFLFFIELAVFFSIRFIQKQKTIFTILTGLSIGAAVLSKWLPALIVLPIWLLLVIDSGKFRTKTIVIQFIILLSVCLIVFLPWQIYIHKAFPLEAAWEAQFNRLHLTQVIEGQTGPFYYYLNKIRINYGELVYLPLIWFLWKTIQERLNLRRLAITVWLIIPLLFFSVAKSKMQAFILFTSPAIFFMIAEFWFALADYQKNHRYKWLSRLVLILLIVLPLRYTIERVKPFSTSEREPAWVVELKKINQLKITNGILFNYDRPIEAMFYTNLTVYPDIPDRETLIGLIEKGYTIMIKNNDKIPENIRSIPAVRII